MKKFKKFLLWSFVTLLVLAISLVTLVMSDIWDIEPPDVSDLIPERVEVADKDNAYTYFKLAGEILYWPEGKDKQDRLHDIIAGMVKDDKLIQELIEKNMGVIELIEHGVACKVCQFPESKTVQTYFNIRSSDKVFNLHKLLTLKTIYERDKSLTASLFDTVLLHSSFASKLMVTKGNSIIDALVSCAVVKFVCTELCKTTEKLSAVELKTFLSQLPQLESMEKCFVEAFKSEYHAFSGSVDYFIAQNETGDEGVLFEEIQTLLDSNSELKHPYFLLRNKTKLLNAEVQRGNIKNIKEDKFTADNIAVKRIEQRSKSPIQLMLRPNGVGIILNRALVTSYEEILVKYSELKADVYATKIAIACELYKRKNDDLPDSLNQLVPEFLDSVPNDPFDGQPFRYDKEKKIVYSVGKNLIDSGGLDRHDKKRRREIGLRKSRKIEDLVFYLEPKKDVE